MLHVNNTPLNLDLIDRRLLATLDENARMPVSRIAKKLRVSRAVIDYRMHQLEKYGIIRGYVGFIDPYLFGLASWKTYLKFQNLSSEKEAEVLDHLEKVPNLWWVIRTTGSYDLMFCVLSRNHFEYYQTLFEFQQRFNDIIFEVAITNHINSRWYSRNYLNGGSGVLVGDVFTTEPRVEQLDTLDIAILNEVAHDARASVVAIANRVKTTARVVSYRLRILEKQKVVVNYRLNLDVSKFGYSYYKVLLSLKEFTKKDITGLVEFFRQQPNIENSSQSYGPWDIEFELEVKDHQEFQAVMQQLRLTFPRIIKKFEYVQIVEEIRSENNFLQYMKLSTDKPSE
ncbi:MAG: winged helix-turn-helix transcriptional regulator [Nanoarchaeota archaeon]